MALVTLDEEGSFLVRVPARAGADWVGSTGLLGGVDCGADGRGQGRKSTASLILCVLSAEAVARPVQLQGAQVQISFQGMSAARGAEWGCYSSQPPTVVHDY